LALRPGACARARHPHPLHRWHGWLVQPWGMPGYGTVGRANRGTRDLSLGAELCSHRRGDCGVRLRRPIPCRRGLSGRRRGRREGGQSGSLALDTVSPCEIIAYGGDEKRSRRPSERRSQGRMTSDTFRRGAAGCAGRKCNHRLHLLRSPFPRRRAQKTPQTASGWLRPQRPAARPPERARRCDWRRLEDVGKAQPRGRGGYRAGKDGRRNRGSCSSNTRLEPGRWG